MGILLRKEKNNKSKGKKSGKGREVEGMELGHPCSTIMDSHTIELGSSPSKCSALVVTLLLQLDDFFIEGLDGIL